jgi:hypothetical protein
MSSIEENLHGRDERDEEELDDLEWWARWGVYVSGTLLASFFGWLLLSRSQVVQALSNTAPELIVKAGLIIYFGAWVFGAPFDLTMQRAVLAKDPDKGRVDLKSVLAFSGIPILGGVVFGQVRKTSVGCPWPYLSFGPTTRGRSTTCTVS